MKKEWDSPPSDYTLIVPNGWFLVSLDPEERDRCILALAEQQFRGNDSAPVLKERLMRDLQKRAKAAYRAGGVEMYLSTLTVGPVPLASSLLVSVLPSGWPGCRTASDLAGKLTEKGHDCRLVPLEAAGDAVREQRTKAPQPEEQMGNTLSTTTVVYHVPIPATGTWLMLTFSTPLEPLAPTMVELFDTVAGTLYWSA
ncbi:hypothetical protein [Streptomyces physcomitrii]|uniref:Uncharacterized protein n=1 Tax=Streptomyces physcomitrii TaxID=2724184 RepID=A0ABX1H8H2_9ACTN|nr:hypothetical protein [Streptomyces physcomitrii]NKI44343.1 hypothetical protein [Streptomyces physcomitrii]